MVILFCEAFIEGPWLPDMFFLNNQSQSVPANYILVNHSADHLTYIASVTMVPVVQDMHVHCLTIFSGKTFPEDQSNFHDNMPPNWSSSCYVGQLRAGMKSIFVTHCVYIGGQIQMQIPWLQSTRYCS